MSDIIQKISDLKDQFRDSNSGITPMKLWLTAEDTKALAEHRATVDRFPVKILAMDITENAAETKVG